MWSLGRLESLLYADEVAAALGEPVRPPTCVALGAAAQICVWRSAKSPRCSLTLTAIVGPLAAHTLQVERRLGVPVAGVGDEGYLRATGLVCVLRCGGHVLKLVLNGSRAPGPAAAVVRLARLAAERVERAAGPGGSPRLQGPPHGSPRGPLPDDPEQAG
jgi:hypothetical protein